jgi:type I restriction enzyme, R subunit
MDAGCRRSCEHLEQLSNHGIIDIPRMTGLAPPQIRFAEMIIEQLTARGVMEPGALYEAPFTGLHAGGPDELFAGKSELIAGIFQAIQATQPAFQSSAG